MKKISVETRRTEIQGRVAVLRDETSRSAERLIVYLRRRFKEELIDTLFRDLPLIFRCMH